MLSTTSSLNNWVYLGNCNVLYDVITAKAMKMAGRLSRHATNEGQ